MESKLAALFFGFGVDAVIAGTGYVLFRVLLLLVGTGLKCCWAQMARAEPASRTTPKNH